MNFLKKKAVKILFVSIALVLIFSFAAALILYPFKSAEHKELKKILTGKKLSVLGDSISTYGGVSNVNDVNSTVANSFPHYTEESMKRSNTWWQRTADKCGMDILVNNSWSGTTVSDFSGIEKAGFNIRAENLHDNTLENNENGEAIYPDIIAVYLGINDFGFKVGCNLIEDSAFWEKIESDAFVPETFDESYALMVYKIKKIYEKSDIFLFTFPSTVYEGAVSIDIYNETVEKIADHYDCAVVDLYNSDLSHNFEKHTLDNLHPNRSGMKIMSECFIDALIKKYT